MAEKRKAESTLCVKIDAKTVAKIELFPASQWQESTQAGAAFAGRYRLRINRRWHDTPEGGPLYLDMHQIMALAATCAAGGALPDLEPAPDLPRHTRVSVPNGRYLAGKAQYDGTRTGTEPLRGHDGRWYVSVLLYGKGNVMVPVDTLLIHRGK